MSEGKRRRYTQGRSRTIELSTLAEIEEDPVIRPENSSEDSDAAVERRTSQDDMCIGTTRVVRGSVKTIARHLSERHNAQKAQKALAGKLADDNSVAEKAAVKLRQDPPEVHRKPPERREFRPESVCGWTLNPEWHDYHAFHACSTPRHPVSRSASFARSTPTPMFVYGLPSDRHSINGDPRDESEFAMPIYYTVPLPPPMYLPMGAAMLRPPPTKLARADPESACSQVCCGGVAQLLWTIICIVLFGVVASLILALCYV